MVDESEIARLVAPVVASFEAEIYDIEFVSGTLRISVDHEDGINSDTIGDIAKAISQALDRNDPISSRYLLEVSTPGIERKLRTPAHYATQIGKVIGVKLRKPHDGIRRFEGELVSCDASGIVVDVEGVQHQVSYDEIETARSTFDWSEALRAHKDDEHDGDEAIDEEEVQAQPTTKKAKAR